MNNNFYFFFLIVPYLSWSFAYVTTSLLTPKKWLKKAYFTLFIITFFVFLFLTALKTYSAQLGVNLIQIYVIVMTMLCFQESIGKKFSCYLFFEMMAVMIEAVSTSIYMAFRSLIPIQEISFFELPKQSGLFDMVGISVFMIILGALFYRKEVSILKNCFSFLNLATFVQFLFPLLVPMLSQGLILNQIDNPNFPILAGVYWLLCLICYPLFLFGVRSLRKQGRKRHFQEQQLLIMKEQLAFSKQSEEEYAALRKWNHDSENHLLSMAYLMDMGKYEEVMSYQNNILS